MSEPNIILDDLWERDSMENNNKRKNTEYYSEINEEDSPHNELFFFHFEKMLRKYLNNKISSLK
jgi:hypothetical protein